MSAVSPARFVLTGWRQILNYRSSAIGGRITRSTVSVLIKFKVLVPLHRSPGNEIRIAVADLEEAYRIREVARELWADVALRKRGRRSDAAALAYWASTRPGSRLARHLRARAALDPRQRDLFATGAGVAA